MWEMVRRVEELNGVGSGASSGKAETVGFAAKVIGVGVAAGLMLTYCSALLDACVRGLH